MSKEYPKVIYKYSLQSLSDTLKLPEYSHILKTGSDLNDEICVWALVDPTPFLTKVDIKFQVCGTGQEVEHLLKNYFYFDTAFMRTGHVWHVFFENNVTQKASINIKHIAHYERPI